MRGLQKAGGSFGTVFTTQERLQNDGRDGGFFITESLSLAKG
jgi:hypothetical protein